jgi:hypothetical protein
MTARLRIGACLSLSGRFAAFGRQAADGLETWRQLAGTADLVISDDRSDRHVLAAVLPDVAARCDLLLGPYSTVLTRAAGRLAAEHGWLIWNHGGAGDDIQAARPGHAVSVLTPTSRYARPWLRHLLSEARRQRPGELVVVTGPGSFGRQVAAGALELAGQLGIRAVRATPEEALTRRGDWDLLSAGVFEDDVSLVALVRQLPDPPRRICAVAAGFTEFSDAVPDPDGIYGIAQWLPGSLADVQTGPAEADFLAACPGGQASYPAVQAAAGAIVAGRCAQLAGSTRPADLWAAAASLHTTTVYGAFGIDPHPGTQQHHQTVLTRWASGNLVRQPDPAGT